MTLDHTALILAAASAVIAAPNARAETEPNKADTPNVIFILADDAGIADFGCYGGKIIHTPNIDKLAAEGMKFTNHYSGSTVCAPSRCCLMTGKHTGHATVRGNSKNTLDADDATVADLFKKAGYATAAIGKWGLGDKPDGQGSPNKHGFDLFFGYLNQGKAHHYYPDYLWKNGKKIEFPDNPTKRTKYSHDLFTKEALDFIENNKKKPFFLYLAYTIPHSDLDVPKDSMAPYRGKLEPEKPYKGKAKHGFPAVPQPTPHAAYAGMISRMDRDIGRIVALLDKLKIADNTIIFFSSDNGPSKGSGADPEFFDSNGPHRGIKRDLYEGGVRCPFIVKWPAAIKPGTTTDHLSAFWDFLPTIADILGQSPTEGIDGISYLPTLLGHPEKQRKHKYLYWEFYEQGGKQAIRMGKWKAVRLDVKENPDAPLELYDLETDPAETKNVAKEHPEIVQKLADAMKRAHSPSDKYSFKEKSKQKKGKKRKKKDKKSPSDAETAAARHSDPPPDA